MKFVFSTFFLRVLEWRLINHTGRSEQATIHVVVTLCQIYEVIRYNIAVHLLAFVFLYVQQWQVAHAAVSGLLPCHWIC
jgi:hypothetical protein